MLLPLVTEENAVTAVPMLQSGHLCGSNATATALPLRYRFER